ncbi:MAG: Holliday junction resolvase RuvX [Patescibacteria group bacterium]|uniref:Putative pre-16S rRNA nuclease n=1 Tax=candidate division WWE3 bacterium TaxID=2053526 RepID=A0A955ECQ8_UNCKA|nr:Holliday junction resolvase RuvX [candidate division WWE3 bacterium]
MPEEIIKQHTRVSKTKEEVLIGLDYGSTNIGLALGKAGLSSPLGIVSGKNDLTAIKEISKYITENRVTKVVIGLPLDGFGKDTLQSKEVRKFAKLLRIYIKLPQEFVNENSTTQEALNSSFAMGISQKRRKTLDHISAAIILKNYYRNLEEQPKSKLKN